MVTTRVQSRRAAMYLRDFDEALMINRLHLLPLLLVTPVGQMPATSPDPRLQLGLEAQLLANPHASAWFGTPGCSGFDDRPIKRVCPSYGQN